jgi:SAM-dependent methyltransferase
MPRLKRRQMGLTIALVWHIFPALLTTGILAALPGKREDGPMQKLNVGCGKDIREGWVNLDLEPLPGVDFVHDINHLPLPFSDEEFDLISCKDVLEHVDYIPAIRDLHRILKPGGRLIVRVPHFTSKDAYSDPTHRRFFTVQTFFYFMRPHFRSYYFDFHFSRFETLLIRFDKRSAYFYNYILEPLVNLTEATQNFYEGSPLRVFPATNIDITLVK